MDGKDKSDIIRKGNELFNKGDIILAYKCYSMANYYGGIEKIADYFFYTKQNPAKAIVLYKQIVSTSDNVRVKQKLEDTSMKIVDIIRTWNEEDDSKVKKEVTLEEKKKYLLAAVENHKNKFHTKDNIEIDGTTK